MAPEARVSQKGSGANTMKLEWNCGAAPVREKLQDLVVDHYLVLGCAV